MHDEPPAAGQRTIHQPHGGSVGEFLLFLKERKKFWLIPPILVLLLLGLVVMLGGTAAAPFIYSLF